MTTPVLLVPHGDAIYALPVEEAKKYALEGESLASALACISEESDVTGQSTQYRDVNYVWYQTRNSRGEVYTRDRPDGEWKREPALD